MTWKPIPGFPDYEASTDGRIRSFKRSKPHILRPHVDERGHAGLGLCKNDEVHRCHVARLILLTFVGPAPTGHTCHRKNGDRSDNRLDNLHWALYQPELTKNKVVEIREKRKSGTAFYTLAHEYDLGIHVISGICRGETYIWCGGPIVEPYEIRGTYRPARISNEDAVRIYHRVRNGETRTAIAEEYNVNISTISKIASGKRRATRELAEADREKE